VFPADTIPAWVSVYTGLLPINHGLLYVYNVFDQHFSDLAKLDRDRVRGTTFWDYASNAGCRSVIISPELMYPAWEVNGVMLSTSPFEKRVDWLRTTRDVSVYPQRIQEKYKIPPELEDLWGGFPGVKHLKDWVQLGKDAIEREKSIGLRLFTGEQWDLFFIFFSFLDIIQHRLWRFFDENDPTYPGMTDLQNVILDYYIAFDAVIDEFASVYPDLPLIVMSDHGHQMRPIKTINVNEYLRRRGHVVSRGTQTGTRNDVRRILLETANRLNIEHWLIKLVVKSKRLTRMSKSVYSSAGSIDLSKSTAYLSSFAGIKSYSFGGIEINTELISKNEYEKTVAALIASLQELKTPGAEPAIRCIRKREELGSDGRYCEIYPDIVFEFQSEYGVGWELHSDLFGKAYDHNVASGGHAKTATLLMCNMSKEIANRETSLIDIAPTILGLLDVDVRNVKFDGQSILAKAHVSSHS
jgi:predicted AlkP superfamily phosphohydrolase/phosphomutase